MIFVDITSWARCRRIIKITVAKRHLFKLFCELLGTSSLVWRKYRIQGCKTYDKRHLVELKNPFIISRPISEYYQYVRAQIESNLRKKRKFSVIRLGDGEAHFLQGCYHGNIQRRHLTDKVTDKLDLAEWRSAYLQNDLRLFELNWSLRKLWIPIEGASVKCDFVPREVIYALVANRDIFTLARGYRVGLIGPESKLKLIESLIIHPAYQEYLGIEGFNNYIYVPEKGACNDTDRLLENIIEQAEGSYCDLYLMGMGIAKLRVQASIRDALNTVIIDIGSALDGIAGIIPKDRPYFGNWVNYKLRDTPNTDIDFMSQKISQKRLEKFGVAEDIVLP